MNSIKTMNSRINHLIKNSIKAQTTKWFSKRASMISATDLSVILGLGHGKTIQDLLENKKYNKRMTDNKYTLHGKKFESEAIKVLEQRRNINIKEIGFTISEDTSYLGATPDGICIDNGEIKLIEIKCPFSRQIDGCVPYGYYTQMQLQMYVCDVENCLFFECNFEEITKDKYDNLSEDVCKGYNKEYSSYWILHESNLVEVARDHDFFNKYLGDLNSFHNQLVQQNKPKKQTRKRKRYSEIKTITHNTRSTKRRKLNNTQAVQPNTFILSKHHMKNFVNNNKCDAWLSMYGNKYYGDEKSNNQFTKQLLKRTKQIKKEYTDKLVLRCEEKGISYAFVPRYYKYDAYLKEMSKKLMQKGVEVIINPMLYIEVLLLYLYSSDA